LNISLKNKNAVVCGSTQGMGKAAAVEFVKLGAKVTLIARNEDSLKKVRNELNTDFNQVHDFIVADFSYPDILKVKINDYVKNNPPVHILVNNTGGPEEGNIIDADVNEFRDAFNSHLICNHILVQALVDGMKKEKYGRIINIISTSVKEPIKGLGVSNTVRWAVASWAKTLAGELVQYGITINNILPGATKTERLYFLFDSWSKNSGKSRQEIEKEWLGRIPAGRFAEPEETAFAIAFLASPSASYINGVNLPVDGGRLSSM
jgi:3-oxoacyl-[acyl-carrier protein] reductase